MTITLERKGTGLPTGNILNKALSSALNKTITTAKKEMSMGVRKVYNIKKRDLDPKITVKKATAGSTESTITIRSKSIGLIHFNATSSKSFMKGEKIYWKTSAKVLKKDRKKVHRGAFISRGKNSKSWQVFRRSSNKRLPLIKLSVITATTMTKKEGADDFFKVIDRDFDKNFQHELQYFSGKQR